MSQFYTNVQVHGSRILYRGVEDGRKVRRKIDYFPTLFVPSPKLTDHTTIYGEYVAAVKPGNIREAKDFLKLYEGVDGFKIYGNTKFEYTYIADTFPDDVEWDIQYISVANIDLEVGSENGFPEPDDANEIITAITVKKDGQFTVFGCGEFNNTRENVTYIKCTDEIDLLKRFLDYWSFDYPDIVTGWNIKFFDIPYLVNRITKILGEAQANRLSPWGVINAREVNFGPGRQFNTYLILGIASLDYIDMYQRFDPDGQSQDSYKLDAIANVVLGERKLSYDEYGSLHTLYRDNYQLFIEYNIRDVELIDKMDKKLKLISLVLTLAYDSKSNYEDAFAQVRMWDAIIYNYLRKKNMVVPPITKHSKNEAYIGAYVKDPQIGMHKWVASFDLDSLYPHLIMQYNISPETLVEPEKYTKMHKQVLNYKGVSIDILLNQEIGDFDKDYLPEWLQEINCTLTPNGQFFTKDRHGFLPEIMETMYNGRKTFKKMSLDAESELQHETDPVKREELTNRMIRYHNLQLAKKVCLNSAYGALGNQFFRFYDIRQAVAITTAGQLSIRWIANNINQYMNKLLNTKDVDYVIASDTDSIYLSLDGLVRQTIAANGKAVDTKQVITFMDKVCKNKIQPYIDKTFGELSVYVNAYQQKMKMKREVLADKGIWTAKKRYILNVWDKEGVAYDKPKIKVSGLEMVKSSTPAYCRKILWESLDVILNKTEDDMIGMIETYRQEFRTQNVADIAFPRGVNNLEHYANENKSIPIHVRGSLLYNKLIDRAKLSKKYPHIKEGEKIKFIYLKQPNPIQSNIISFPTMLPKELDMDKYIDYELQFLKSYIEPLKIILDSIGWKTEKVSTLDSFFM